MFCSVVLVVASDLRVAYSAEFGSSLLAYAQYEKGLKEFEAGEYAKAVESFTQSIAKDATSASVFQHRALAFHYLGHFEKALSDFDVSISLQTPTAEILGQRAVTKTFLHQDEQAAEDLNAVEGLIQKRLIATPDCCQGQRN